jgi:uncharacterized membrane-anchored protein
MLKARAQFVFWFLVALFTSSALAQDIKPMTDDEKKAVWDAVSVALVNGPTDVALGDQAKLHLDATHQYVPRKEAAALMRMWGNSTGDGFYGLVFDKSPDVQWTIAIDHVAEGFVKDDDAKTWNADELLQSLKDGTAAQNEERAKIGIPPLEIVGWVQKPNYDASKHQLAWSIKGINPTAPANEPSTINFNTYALGRDGYFQINLMTTDKTIDKDKAAALKVVSAVDYNQGKRYADFNAATDHIAEYGLAALVAGVAAKKLGLLAIVGLFIAKFAKIIIAAIAVGGGGLFKLFRRKSDDA